MSEIPVSGRTDDVASRIGGDPGLLISGQQVMGIYGEWNTGKGYIPKDAPNLKYDTAPVPSLDPGKYGAGFLNGNAFMIMTGGKNPAAAAKFGMYLMTDAPSKTMALQNASVPQLKSLLVDPEMTSIPHFQAFLDIAAAEPGRCVVLDASRSPEQLAEQAWQALASRLRLPQIAPA